MSKKEAPHHPLTSPGAAHGENGGAGAPHSRGNITPASDKRTTLARAAVAYARRGWPVLPCVPRGKLPLTRRGYLDASADVEQVAAWWRTEPHANIGVVPGRVGLPDGGSLVVIDLDGAAGRDAATELRVPDDTAAVTTGRGEHRYFRLPPGVRLGNRPLAQGLDVRHAGGYVLAPPSVHPSGTAYSWLRPPRPDVLRALPDDLLERLTARREALSTPAPVPLYPVGAAVWRRVEAYLRRVPSGLSEGDGRNSTAYRLAAWLLHDAGLSESDTADVLAAWNADHVQPLAAGELASVLRSAARHGRGRAS